MNERPRARAPFRRLPADRRRGEILEAALELFGRRGEDGVSVDEIAAAADTSRNSVYRLFGSKEQLHFAAMQQLAVKLVEAQSGPVEGTPSEQLAVRLRRHLDVVEEYEAGYLALMRVGGPDAPAEVRLIRDEVRERCYQRLYDGLGVSSPSKHLEATVHAWVAVMEWMTQEWLRTRRLDREDVVTLLSLYLGGMLAGTATMDGSGGEWLPKLVGSESPSSPFGVHIAHATDVFNGPILNSLLEMTLSLKASSSA